MYAKGLTNDDHWFIVLGKMRRGYNHGPDDVGDTRQFGPDMLDIMRALRHQYRTNPLNPKLVRRAHGELMRELRARRAYILAMDTHAASQVSYGERPGDMPDAQTGSDRSQEPRRQKAVPQQQINPQFGYLAPYTKALVKRQA